MWPERSTQRKVVAGSAPNKLARGDGVSSPPAASGIGTVGPRPMQANMVGLPSATLYAYPVSVAPPEVAAAPPGRALAVVGGVGDGLDGRARRRGGRHEERGRDAAAAAEEHLRFRRLDAHARVVAAERRAAKLRAQIMLVDADGGAPGTPSPGKGMASAQDQELRTRRHLRVVAMT